MASDRETADRFKSLGIQDLDREWVEAIWSSDFTENPEPPAAIKRQWSDHRELLSSLKDAIDCCTPWARVDFATLPQGFWKVLCDNDIVPRSLLAGLHHFMSRVDSLLSQAVEREIAIAAAHLYILLLEIPGSGAYRIQQPLLFEEALGTFKLWPKSEGTKRKRPDSQKANSSQQQHHGKRARRGTGGGGGIVDAEMEDDDEDEEEVVALTTQEADRIYRAIFHAIKEVVYLLRNVPLKSSEEVLEQVLTRLADVSRISSEQDWDNTFGKNVSLDSVYSVAQLAYLGMEAMASGSHGDAAQMLRMVFKSLLPNILMLIGENQGVAATSIPKYVQQTKDHAEAFACHMYKEVGEKSIPCIRVLMQHMCVKVPDKMEYRTRVSHTIAHILAVLTPEAEASFVQWLYLYSKNAKISYRVFALEVVAALLERPERHTSGTGEGAAGQQQFLSHRFLLDIMISRCSDRAPTVRAKALSCFAQFTALAGNEASNSIANMLAAPTAKTGITPVLALAQVVREKEGTPNQEKPAETEDKTNEAAKDDGMAEMDCGSADAERADQAKNDTIEIAQDAQTDKQQPSGLKKGATPGNLMGGSPALLFGEENGEGFVGSGGLLACLKERVCDDKVGVRKAALQALENVFKLQCMNFDLQLLEVLRDRCRDTALSVRKQALDSLTSLLKENARDERVQRVWLQGILPAVSDRESTASEKCLLLLQELVLDGVCRKGSSEASKHLAWSLLCQLMQPDLCELRIYFQRVCRLWARQKLLTPTLIKGLATHTDGNNSVAAWMFLGQVSTFCPHLDKTLVLQTWRDLTTSDLAERSTTGDDPGQRDGPSSEILVSVLSVMGSLATKLEEGERKRLVEEIADRLVRVMEAPNIIGAMVETLYKLCCANVPENATTNPLLDQVCNKILQTCDSYLSSVILSEDGPKLTENSEEILIARIFLLGEIAQLCPYQMPRRVFTLVQSLLAGPGAGLEGSELPSSQGLTQFSQQPLSQFRTTGAPVSMAVRAHAFVTLGKLCLHHEGLAKQCIAALARELEIAEDAAVRNNVALVMCDLCIRYPNLVDRYIPNLATCLKDKDKLVRKQTLTQLTQLVLEDYVKWRGPLFFRFVSVLVDEVDTVRDFAEYCLVELLLKRYPGMLMQQFMEGVFHFNNYKKHAVFNQFSQSDRERELFSLEGPENAEKRMKIFRFMLGHMTDEHRFKLTGKLVQEVLAAFVDGVIPLDTESSSILKDTLNILCCKEIKLATLHSKQANPDDIVEEMQMAEAVMAQAKTKLISQVVKKNTIENTIPIIIALKHMLEKQHSPLLGDLMLYLKELMKDYRNEIKDILAADRQLASEIEFDLRKFDENQLQQQQEQQQKQAAAATPGTAPVLRAGGGQRTPQPGALQTPVLLSPKSVAGRSPSVRQSPKTPAARGTATKERLLAAQAIVNSARKALASAARRGSGPNTPNRPSPAAQGSATPGPAPATPVQASKNGSVPRVVVKQEPPDTQDTQGGVDRMTQEAEEGVRKVQLNDAPSRTPERRIRSPLAEVSEDNTSKDSDIAMYRAISTPDKTIANITFQAAMDMSIIPLSSPIPSALPIRVYSEGDPTKGPGTKGRTPQIKKENLILMCSPEQPAPRPRTWNIKSPQPGQEEGSSHGGRRRQLSQPSSSSDEMATEGRRSTRRGGAQDGGGDQGGRRKSGRLAKGR